MRIILILLVVCAERVLSNGMPQPEKAYNVLWQSPTGRCMNNFNINLKLVDYGFGINARQSYQGASSGIFYYMGYFPYHVYETGEISNGGIPQRANLKNHLVKSVQDIGSKSFFPVCDPDVGGCDEICPGDWVCIEGTDDAPTFVTYQATFCMDSNNVTICGHGASCTKMDESICGIVDPTYESFVTLNMEWWRPVWETLFSKEMAEYRDMSIDEVREDEDFMNPKNQNGDPLPTPSEGDIIAEAKKRYESGSVSWITESVAVVHALRPNTKVGYYHYPYCFNGQSPSDFQCKDTTRAFNDEIHYMWTASSMISPSSYNYKEYTETEYCRFQYQDLCESQRAAFLNYTGNWEVDYVNGVEIDAKPVVQYITYKRNMTSPPPFYSPDEVTATVAQPAFHGLATSIMWGASIDSQDWLNPATGRTDDGYLCQIMRDYVVETLGPASKKVMEWAEECAGIRCSGNGRCAHLGSLCNSETQRDALFQDMMTKDAAGNFVYPTDPTHLQNNYFCRCKAGFYGVSCETAAV